MYLSEARPRPYQHRYLQADIHFVAVFEIYKIDAHLHFSKLKAVGKCSNRNCGIFRIFNSVNCFGFVFDKFRRFVRSVGEMSSRYREENS